METRRVRNDFKKAMSSVVLTAGATLADAERVLDQAGAPKRKKAEQDVSLVKEFCRLLISPVEEYGPGFAQIPGFAETYCRTHLSLATDFLRRSMATHDLGSPECKRLAHTAALVERSLKQYLDEKIAIRCWFGDRVR
jgi:hypothetical protein